MVRLRGTDATPNVSDAATFYRLANEGNAEAVEVWQQEHTSAQS